MLWDAAVGRWCFHVTPEAGSCDKVMGLLPFQLWVRLETMSPSPLGTDDLGGPLQLLWFGGGGAGYRSATVSLFCTLPLWELAVALQQCLLRPQAWSTVSFGVTKPVSGSFLPCFPVLTWFLCANLWVESKA